MRNKIEPSFWQINLSEFGKRNNLRPTRLEVLGPARKADSDFWLEDGMLLAGIDLQMKGAGGPHVEIMFQAPAGTTQNHMTHTVAGVKCMELEASDGRDETLEIEDQDGVITLLRFESEVPSPEAIRKESKV